MFADKRLGELLAAAAEPFNSRWGHRRKIRRTHVHFVHPVHVIHFFNERGGLFPILWKGRVGMKRGRIFLAFLSAGMSHEVDECVHPSRIIVGYPVTQDIDSMLGLQLCDVTKDRLEGGHLPGSV